ncbi:MAG: hypothetical protein KBT02_07225 [Treponema sp.]|nr:hypothetical protein [Candidatus Treponema caballi]
MAQKEYEQIPEPVMQAAMTQATPTGPQQKPVYAGSFDSQLQSIFDKISNREPFQYDVNADPLYQAAKDNYIQQGKLAMKDTMGQAAALTGGYGSTYGQQVGQQAYDAHLKDLGAVIPELYGMAYDMYRDKGDDLLTQYGLIGDMRDTEYGRYRDSLDDWNYEQEVARQKEETEYNRRIDEEKTAYSRQQQAYANLVALIKASGYQPTDQELAAAGLTRAAANSLANEYTRSITPVVTPSSGGSSGGGRSSGGSSGGGSGYDSSVAAIQQQLNAMGAGLSVDGIWGPLTQAAYDKYMGGGGSGSGTKGSYNSGELLDAAAAGASKSQIEKALQARGVDTNDKYVQADIKWALSK